MKKLNLSNFTSVKGFNLNQGVRAVLVLLLFTLGIGNAWAGGGTAYLKLKSATPAQGLVYQSLENTAPISEQYVAETEETSGGNTGGDIRYSWSKPARGFKVVKGNAWSGYKTAFSSSNATPYGANTNDVYGYYTEDPPANWDGNADHIRAMAGGKDDTHVTVNAVFTPADSYNVLYAPAAGGTFHVSYSYDKSLQDANGVWKFYTLNEGSDVNAISGEWTPTGNQTPVNTKSYASDEITLSTSATNWTGWYENGVRIPTDNKTNYKYVPSQDAIVTAEFKNCVLGEPTGDLNPSVNALGEAGYTITIPVTGITGTWEVDDFTIVFECTEGATVISKGTATYAPGVLTIPYTYAPETWGGSTYHVTVTPDFGEAIGFDIEASAIENINFEARVFANGANPLTDEALNTGDLVDMLEFANSRDDKPLLQLTQDKEINVPLVFTKSMTFDINGNTLTSTGTSAINVAAVGVDVKVTDDSYSHRGVIVVSGDDPEVVSVATFSAGAKLTLNGGTLSATNESGAAYGIDVKNGSVFYQAGGHLTISSPSEARGVNVATGSDYATITGGDIMVSAPANAYGIWSAGSTNVDNSIIDVKVTSGANANGFYVNGGVTTCNNVALTVNAATQSVYGALVNAGRLNYTGGSIDATTVTSNAFGVHIAAGAIATIQARTKITAGAGSLVRGINNLGKVTILNADIDVSATSDATAVNSEASAENTTIEEGKYFATVTNGGAVYGLHHQYGALNVDGGEFKGIATTGNGAWGALMAADGSMTNATIWGETKGGTTAYGFVGGVVNKNITLTGCTITGQSALSKAYAIYSRSNVSASNCNLGASALSASEACGFYAESGNNELRNCIAEVYSYANYAYGINQLAGSVIVNDGSYRVTAAQSEATEAQNSELYGIKTSATSTTEVHSARFVVNAENTSWARYGYAAYILGRLETDNSVYDATARIYAYGIMGKGSSSNLILRDNTITATAVNGQYSYGVYAEKSFSISGDIVNATSTSTDTYALFFTNAAQGEVLDGKFGAMGNNTSSFGAINASGTVGKVLLTGGLYKTNANLSKYVAPGYNLFNLDMTHAEFANGYRHTIAETNPCTAVCLIKGGSAYATLEEALQYVNDHPGSHTIIMTQSYTLPEGNYILPANVSLLVPYTSEQNTLMGVSPTKRSTKGVRSEHLRLTFADGVNMSVNGVIEVSGEMYCQQTGLTGYNSGSYGRIHLSEGSRVELNSGSKLYAWGFVTGKGEIKAKNGSEVHEFFQIGDMKSMSSLVYVYVGLSGTNSEKFFPISQYFIHNVEAPTTYYYGSSLNCAMSTYYSGEFYGDDNVRIVGTTKSMFLVTDPDESSWVRKYYDATKDNQMWEINSSAKLGSISLSFDNPLGIGPSKISMNSANYILPIASNWKLHVLDGSCQLTQDTELLPGAEVEINKTAAIDVNTGLSLYVFDKDQWTIAYAYTDFSPSWTNGRPSRTIKDAAINVHGRINLASNAKLYTTRDLGGDRKDGKTLSYGANIFSNNEDAGSINLTSQAPSADIELRLIRATANNAAIDTIVIVNPALLKNGVGAEDEYTPTSGAGANHSFVYIDNAWVETFVDGCFKVIGSTYYANPSEYVALPNGKTPNDNHTYTTINGDLLILMDDCQWWEVEATTDPAVFECKKEGYEGFYYYDNTTSKWKLKTVDVKFYSAETGDNVLKTIVTDYNGIPDQAVIASNPTKETTAEYTYAFYGWKSSVTGTEYKWTDQLEVATADMSYRPVFTATKRNYTITLNDANNGATVYLEVPYQTMPSYEAKKDATAEFTYSFNGWSPAFAAVTGTATYTAQWTSTKNRYTVTWMNGDDVLETDKNQEYGKLTSYDGATPTKVADNEYVYTFSNWLNSLTGNIRVNNETVTGAITYTAQFSTTPRYMITFANYDGTQLQKEPVTQNETPIYNGVTPARARDLDGYYIFTGWKRNSTGVNYAPNDVLPAATEKETYTAQYSYTNDLFTITLHNVDGNGATWSGKFGLGSTPFYNPNNNDIPVIPTKTGNAQYSYTFDGWSLTSGGAKLDPVPAVTDEAEYWALFTQSVNKYDITFANIDGFGASQTIQVEYGSVPVCPVVPKKEEGVKTWAFESWAEGDPVAVTGDATYTAQFSSTYTTRQFDITFDLDNGTQVVVPVTYGETPSWTGETPVKPADAQYTYTFSSWYPAFEPVTEEASYLALYTQTVRSYTVRFVNYDGTELKSSSLNFGATPTPPSTTPTRPVDEVNKKGYTFSGWSPSITQVTGNATYTAQYNEVSLVASVTTSANATSFYNSWSSALSAANSSSGCTLKLYSDVTASNNTTISGNFTLDLNGCKISCTTSTTSNTRLFYITGVLTVDDSHGGGKIYYEGSGNANYYTLYPYHSGATALIVKNGIIECKKSGGNKDRYATPVGIYYGEVIINGGEFVATSTKSAYAFYDWGEVATITGGKFKASGSSSKIFSDGSKTTVSGGYYSVDPTGMTIANGYEKVTINEDGYIRKVVPKSYTLTWNLNGGTVTTAGTAAAVNATGSPSGSVPYTTALTAPVVTKTGYNFSSWSPSVAATMPAAATTYAAQWTPVNYNITYTLNGGSATNPATYNIETTTFALNNPTKNGYDFTGWTGSNGSTPQTTVSVTVGSTGDKSYTANWTPTNYNITYDLAGGSVTPANPSGYTIETATFSLNNPTRTGYDFAGWTGSNGSTPQTSVSVNLGSTGDKAYTANWTPRNDTHYTVKHYKQALDGSYSETPDETENLQGTTATNVTPGTKNYTGFTAPATQTEAIAADGSLVIEYEYTRNSYELSWDANGGTISGAYTSGSVLFEAPITAPTVTRAGYEFAEWNATPLTTMPAEPLAYTAQWTIDADLVVEEGAPVVVSEDEQVTTTTVHVSGELQIEEGTTLATDNLILEASAENSGEITGGGDVTVTPVTGNVYFDLTLNTWGRHWHSFGVPWQVDLDEHQLVEVKNKNGEPCNRPLVLDVDYDIVWYNGQTRADHHGYVPACWEYIVDYTDERHAQLYPGKAYMIGFASAVGTVRFVKKSGAPIFYNENVEVMENGYNGDDVHGGWNAIANPKVYHTLMSGLTGVSFAQVHKSDTIGADTYQPCSLDDHKFVVGMAVYVQAQETQPVTINKAGSQPVISAPHRRVQGTQDINTVMRCEVEIAPEGGKMADRIYVQPEDEKEDRYVAGKDVSKMGVSGKRAQMWIERYGQKLCVNTIAPVNDKANYPLSVYAPADGNYSIYLNNQPSEDITLYLTYDGRAIWNLSSGEYMATLNKGTDTHYGLRIVRKTPAVATGIEETTILNGDAVRKVIVDDKIFVIRGNNVYSIDGQMVK